MSIGPVGWLSLTIVASTFLLVRAADRRLMLTLAVLVPVYVVAFYTGNFAFRAIAGTALLAAIVWLLSWAWNTYLAGEPPAAPGGDPRHDVVRLRRDRGRPHPGGAGARDRHPPGDTIGAHASAMTFGYLVLTAMGFIEWRLLGTRGSRPSARSRPGRCSSAASSSRSLSWPGPSRSAACSTSWRARGRRDLHHPHLAGRHAQLIWADAAARATSLLPPCGRSSRCCCSCTSCSRSSRRRTPTTRPRSRSMC